MQDQLAVANELRQPELRWGARVHQATLAIFAGRLDEAKQHAEDAFAVGQRCEIASAIQMHGVFEFAYRRLRGGLEELVPLIKAMVEQYPLVPAWRSGYAYLYRELAMVDEAREQLDVLAADDFAMLPHDGNYMVGAAILANVCNMLEDKERAAYLYDDFVPYADFNVIAGLPADCLGTAHHFLMLLAATLERWDDFEHHAGEALARNAAMGGRPWLATSQLEIAQVLTKRGRPGHAERARELLDACLASCDELDMPGLAARARGVGG